MTARHLSRDDDPIGRNEEERIAISIEGTRVEGIRGQTIAGVLLGAERDAWRVTSKNGRGRGVFCGIGVCFDCILTVNDERDVRACQRRAGDGDVVTIQADDLPEVSL
jgi:hypothetical protein